MDYITFVEISERYNKPECWAREYSGTDFYKLLVCYGLSLNPGPQTNCFNTSPLLQYLLLQSPRSNLEEARYAAQHTHAALVSAGHNVTNITIPIIDSDFNIGIFSAIIGAVFVFGILRALMFFKVSWNN